MSLTEDTLVQQTTADYLRDALGWRSVFAYNEETFGPEGTLGRRSDREVVLTRTLGEKLIALNPGLPEAAYQDALRQIVEPGVGLSALALNREKYELLKDGVSVVFRNAQGERVKQRLRVFDFDEPANNDFLAVRELWIRGDLYRRRADVIGFVNGIPLLFMELKNVHKDTRAAYEQNLKDYLDTVPHLFHHNAFLVLANGVDARIGGLGGRYEHFHEWKRLEETAPGAVDMETLLKGVCDKRNFLDLFENYILFDDSGGRMAKIVARNHQYLGVNKAIRAVQNREASLGKLGVFWHTQGSGKSYSMLFFTRKVHRKLGGQFTFLILTDRDDLDTQIYKTYAGCGLVDHDRDPCRAASGDHLKGLLAEHKTYVFSLIQKFNEDVDPVQPYSPRGDIIVITDEAHRTQYGRLALNLRNALPKASYIGFTGTPLFANDEITRRVFGDYVSTYDFQRAVDDKATVPLYYDARGEKLKVATEQLNEKIAAKLEEFEAEIGGDVDVQARLERDLARDYHIITADERLDRIARDFVEHYSTGWESGKAMLVCIDKITCARMHALIQKHWTERIWTLERELRDIHDEQECQFRHRQLKWMGETRMAVVVSEEQGEVERFRKWDIDIKPHRKLMKEGFELADGQRLDMESAFKREEHPFRVAIVCAMWLTGFDVPSLGTLYLDKPLKAHTLMQAIARANRVAEGKNNGLIVDYCGILKNLRKALATFAGTPGPAEGPPGERDPAKPNEELLADLAESISYVRAFLVERGSRLEDITEKTGFARNAAIVAAKEAANENDQTRKRFEVMAREVFKKFKACITVEGVNRHRHAVDAINIIYKSLQDDREKADITDILRALHQVVDEAIVASPGTSFEEGKPYDISKIDFDRLRKEFERSPTKKTTVQNLKQVIEARLARLIAQNPLRTDFQAHYEQIVAEYNREKDRVTIEKTFEVLMRLVAELDTEQDRAVREGLDEETLAVYDLLLKPELTKAEITRIKKVASGLLTTLKERLKAISNWQEREASRDAVRIAIRDYLWDERTGLPVEFYDDTEVENRSSEIFRHVFRAYASVPSPIYC
ncbi:MAG: type I restriction endonuclease subunit R [Gammaproteobacteria bacterium]|nr:type I restriction endonuclease subunit R [Gammaproteobacteria bacterium]